jgi:tetratricopeptide (TPR) repeat protein
MSEDSERVSSGLDSNGAGIDPTAVALALAGASRKEADAFLREQRSLAEKQSSLIDLQKHHLHEEIEHLHLDMWEKRLGVWLRAATFCVGLAVAGALSLMVWEAAHANGLIVDEFTVPPDLAARGLTGQVVAGQLLSDLLSLQARSSSTRAASSYANNWGNNLKVEIPETGVSISELSRFLREWLGHESHVSGAVIRTAGGVAIMASAGSDAFPTVTGAEADLDGLMQTMAETIYRRTQPYRYAIYLFTGYAGTRLPEAEAALRTLAINGTPEDRYWAYNGLVSLYATENRWENVVKAAESALALRPGALVPNFFLARNMMVAERNEDALAAGQAALASTGESDIGEQSAAAMRLAMKCVIARMRGDFPSSTELCNRARQLPDAVSIHQVAVTTNLMNAADLHDAAALHAGLAELRASLEPQSATRFPALAAWGELYLGRWSPSLIAQASLAEEAAQMRFLGSQVRMTTWVNPRLIQPPIAYATALSGDFRGAHVIIDRTPGDCDLCLRVRGRIDALQKNFSGADFWFAAAVAKFPSIPFAYSDWGHSLVERGQPDAAIARFRVANQKGPHFADPLEGWGEALMAKNQSHLALAKFAEADKYAPNWGRLHLKWGEALVYAGKRDDAKAQFSRAAVLDLTPTEKTELARVGR